MNQYVRRNPARPVQGTYHREEQTTTITANNRPDLFMWCGRGDMDLDLLQYAEAGGWKYLFAADRLTHGRDWRGVTNDPKIGRLLQVVNFTLYTPDEVRLEVRLRAEAKSAKHFFELYEEHLKNTKKTQP